MKNFFRIDPFSIVAILVIVVSAIVYYNVYYTQRYYPVFTSQEQVDASKEASFGFLANYL